jgi:hypothetical protein
MGGKCGARFLSTIGGRRLAAARSDRGVLGETTRRGHRYDARRCAGWSPDPVDHQRAITINTNPASPQINGANAADDMVLTSFRCCTALKSERRANGRPSNSGPPDRTIPIRGKRVRALRSPCG